ncbi:MAG: tyrosine-type recombinase/integrase [Desulfobaccales bacterium]
MSVYFQKGRGWKHDFTLNGQRYTSRYFKTKKEAKQAEIQKREEVLNPPPAKPVETISTDITFLDLVNRRLDHVKAYHSATYYHVYQSSARKWVRQWKELSCSEISRDMVERFILDRSRVSAFTANKEIRYLKAMFNFGKKKGWVTDNPVVGLSFLPMAKKLKYIPALEDIDKLIALADLEVQDYLWLLRDTFARVSEVNRLSWDDVNLEQKYVVLYTRKKRGGHLTPRKVPMTQKVFDILSRRFSERERNIPWVFWHSYVDQSSGEREVGPFKDRREVLKNLCAKAGIRRFGFHALRHAGASLMDNCNIPLGSIQRILGHENRTTTEIYLHSINQSEFAAMAVYEQARGESHSDSHSIKGKGFRPDDLKPI